MPARQCGGTVKRYYFSMLYSSIWRRRATSYTLSPNDPARPISLDGEREKPSQLTKCLECQRRSSEAVPQLERPEEDSAFTHNRPREAAQLIPSGLAPANSKHAPPSSKQPPKRLRRRR